MSKTKVKKTRAAKPEATPQPSAPVTTDTSITREPWSPDHLLAIAEQEEARRTLSEYSGVIRMLRDEKNFTFREIANWLQGHQVLADHNAVYREYTKGMPQQVADGEALADHQIEQEEGGR